MGKLKRFKRIAMRCEKTVESYAAFVGFACGLILVKSIHRAWFPPLAIMPYHRRAAAAARSAMPITAFRQIVSAGAPVRLQLRSASHTRVHA